MRKGPNVRSKGRKEKLNEMMTMHTVQSHGQLFSFEHNTRPIFIVSVAQRGPISNQV